MFAQQIFSAFNEGAANTPCQNATVANATVAGVLSVPRALPTDITSLLSFLLSFSALSNWLKLVVFGSVLETLRRLGFHLYYKISDSFFVTAHFEDGDTCYDWMMHWLATQPSWKVARRVHVTTRTFGLSSSAVMVEGEPEDGEDVANGNRPISYLPTIDSSHIMWYKRHWMRVTRGTKEGGYYGRREDVLDICLLTWDHRLLNSLLIEAKKSYEAAQENTISIYVSDTSNNWRHIASRPKRPLTSIVLDPGIKDLLHDDARDFLKSKSWYAARGIPFRRGYLLYGAPGSGKTSIIHSLAGELGLDVYVISLSRVGLDDTALNEVISELPEKCIALMEDIDAAFSQVMNREEPEDDEEKSDKPKNPEDRNKAQPPPPSTSRISLSGLLNALDGVGAQEGRILFATTNKYKSLDPALCRPGRMDIHVEFKLASQYQARELYRCFYLPDSELEKDVAEKKDKPFEDAEVSDADDGNDDSGYSSVNEKEVTEADPLLTLATSDSGSPVAEAVSFIGYTHGGRAPKLSAKKIAQMAASFAELIPEREFSMAALQGYLMTYKTRPLEAIKEAPAWVAKERAESGKKVQAPPATAVPIKDEVSDP
jgi:chaperone BCS1